MVLDREEPWLLTTVVDRVQQKLLRTTCNKLLKKLIMLFIFTRVCYIMDRVGRSCACLEPNSYAKRGQNLPKEAKLQFF